MGAPKTAEGKPIVSIFPTEGTRKTIVTHNWCDRTTWYQKSTRVVAETPTATTPGEVYTLAHTGVIDVAHGKLWAEDDLKDGDGNSYLVVVTVDGVSADENDPHTGVGAYEVDYDAGVITFDPPIDVDSDVLVTYCYAGSSEFLVGPSAGKTLLIRTVEVQFSQDVEMLDTVDFEPYGYVDYFAPQYLQSNGGPYPPGTKIPLGRTRYKTMLDFQAESNGALPTIPAVGGAGWRGIHGPIIVFPWDYAAMLPLPSAAGLEIRIKLQHDTPFGGEFGTATLYCLSENS